MVQWLRLCPAMQGTPVRSLVQEDPTCCRATKPVYWACILEAMSHSYRAHMKQLLKPASPSACALQTKKLRQWEACIPQLESGPRLLQLKPEQSNEDPAQSKINFFFLEHPLSNAGDTGSIPNWGAKVPHTEGQLSPHATTRESPWATAKTQHSHNLKNKHSKITHTHSWYSYLSHHSMYSLNMWQIAMKRREAKSKEQERYTHLNAEFQRVARRDKKTFLSDQCREIKENNRWERLAISSRKLEISRKHFMQRWAQ